MKNLLLPSSPSSPTVLSGACPVLSRPLSRLRAGSGLVVLSLAMLAAGCSTPMSERQRGTAVGAGVGAGVGAVIGSVTGGKAGQSAVIGGVVGAVAGNLWSKRMEERQKALEQATQGTAVQVARTADNRIRVNIPSDFSFDVGRSAIKPQMRPVLDELARNTDAALRMNVIGYTDSTGSDAVNRPLSLDRAESVRDYLVGRGVTASRIVVDGRGASDPVASNDSESGRAMNRRVEIYLSEPAPAGG
ncbi:MAG: hypothetical protein RL489_2649 [Pseudomonadota bacterium]|jgi:outer membrane protein OmpA-like peptidoglycan-associated protein